MVQFQLPAHSLVFYWVQRRPFDLSSSGPPAERVAAKFFGEETDEETMTWRKEHLKMIPNITEGGFVVKKVVGSRPVTVAKDEVLSTVHVGPNHVELDMDV